MSVAMRTKSALRSKNAMLALEISRPSTRAEAVPTTAVATVMTEFD